jgi:sialidase-1
MCGTGFEVEPTGWWQGNGSVADAVSGRNAVLHGDAAFGPGIVGDAFVLDGEGDFVDVPDHPTLNVGSEDFTVSLWVRFASTQGEQVLVEDWIQTYDRRTMEGWTLTKLKSNVIGFGAATAGGVDTEPLDLPIDTWIHVAARRRAGSMSVFIDGELVANRRMTNPGQSADSDASLKFGHRGSRDDTPGSLDRRGFFLNGDLDEATIFVGHGLSDEAIRNIFESQSSCVV